MVGFQGDLIIIKNIKAEAEIDVEGQQDLGWDAEDPEIAEGEHGPINYH